MRPYHMVSLALLLVACGSGQSGTAAETAAQPRQPTIRRDRNVLLRTELTDVQIAEMSAFQAIRQFRPTMLSAGGAASMNNSGGLTVYVEQTRQGGVDALNQIRMTEVERIEYLSGSEATLKFGTGHSGGALIVRRRK